ncbi:MAG: hypothetical protein US11_C0001G0044 [Candidatus Roizmanbacteria bacterium GW2011_GWA2_36_23]|uniref:Uncharacterized protein n=1 Tax=Candidatus Roizmanbacteria bacterium GW2011_GWA2_36_23 TaxID=1618480 RepID=A0A0G0ELX0_9BACT|nr:MAG: hypothetical protein US11_C0001G0044 [Candidatus Roizmanbacteria bacterium GW2011_GWA2_36_23]
MKSESILFLIIGGFLCAMLVFLIIIYKPSVPSFINQSVNNNRLQAVASENDTVNDLKSRIRQIEENTTVWAEQQKSLKQAFLDLKTFISTQSAQNKNFSVSKPIVALANTQGSLFITTSTTYTPMGMYLNVRCPKDCILWINFYTTSKNIGSPASTQGNSNIYDIFIDDSDRSISSQASYSVPSSSFPVSLNASVSVAAGFHTIDIRVKTTAGTLQSDSSSLQVMAIEK